MHLLHLIHTAPLLAFFIPNLEIIVYTDASEYAMGGYIALENPEGERPVAFWSKKFSPTERA
jgi:hypothetical protein